MKFQLKWTLADTVTIAIGFLLGAGFAVGSLFNFENVCKSDLFQSFVLDTKITDWLGAVAAIAAVLVAAKAFRWNRFQTQRPLIAEKDKTLEELYNFIDAFFEKSQNVATHQINQGFKDEKVVIFYLDFIKTEINNTQDRRNRNYIARHMPPPFESKLGPRGRFVEYNRGEVAPSLAEQIEVCIAARDKMLTYIMAERIRYDRYGARFLDF